MWEGLEDTVCVQMEVAYGLSPSFLAGFIPGVAQKGDKGDRAHIQMKFYSSATTGKYQGADLLISFQSRAHFMSPSDPSAINRPQGS